MSENIVGNILLVEVGNEIFKLDEPDGFNLTVYYFLFCSFVTEKIIAQVRLINEKNIFRLKKRRIQNKLGTIFQNAWKPSAKASVGFCNLLDLRFFKIYGLGIFFYHDVPILFGCIFFRRLCLPLPAVWQCNWDVPAHQKCF